MGIVGDLARHGKLPGCLLFTGTAGVGKRSAATALAALCNCSAPSFPETGTPAACHQCPACKRIASGNHPDVLQIGPSGQFIRVEQVRSLLETLARRPYEARLRVVIVAEAQALHVAAGNSLLKMLEEPPERTLLILTATQVSDLMPTIVSRCLQVAFNPLAEEVVAELLQEHAGLSAEAASLLAPLASGSYTRARSLAGSGWLQRRQWLIGELQVLSCRSLAARLALAERLAAGREQLAVALRVMQLWLRDLLIWPVNPARVVNRDMLPRIAEIAPHAAPANLQRQLAAIRRAESHLDANANPRVTLDALILQLQGR